VTRLADAQAFIERSRVAESPQEMAALMSDIAAYMGFDHYSLMHHVDLSSYRKDLGHMAEGELILLTSHPESWVEHYIEDDLLQIDPVVAASNLRVTGFSWNEIATLIDMTTEQRGFLDDVARSGIGDGCTVPIHAPGQASGSCSFSMRLGRPLPTSNLPMAHLIGAFAFEAARAVVVNARKLEAQHTRLTERQVECAILVGRGLTEPDIAKQLGISEETVKRHLKEARTACGATKSFQVVIRLLYEGRISLTDLLHMRV